MKCKIDKTGYRSFYNVHDSGAWKGAGEAGAGFGTKFKMAAGAGFKQTASAWDSGIKDQGLLSANKAQEIEAEKEKSDTR